MHKEILEDLVKDCPCESSRWCFLKDLLLTSGFSDRQAEQVRLIYDYRYMQSKEEGKDIGRERALKEFIEKYAKKFADVYQDGMKHKELSRKVFQIDSVPLTN